MLVDRTQLVWLVDHLNYSQSIKACATGFQPLHSNVKLCVYIIARQPICSNLHYFSQFNLFS